MSVEDELRALRAPEPAGLVPPPDLADTVLHGLRRRRRRTALAAVAVLAAAVAVPVGLRTGGPDGIPAAAGPSVTAPEPPTRLADLPGGPVTVTAFTVAATGRTSLLDPATGRYVEVPYETALVSPDQTLVAVHDGDRTGLVSRASLLRGTTTGLRWTGLTGSPPAWSPDGGFLLATEVEKDPALTYVLTVYDVATAGLSTTRLTDPEPLGYPVWAPNSLDFLVPTRDGMQVLHPDGTRGPAWEGPVGAVAYSPDRRRATVDPSGLMTDRPAAAAVVDTEEGTVLRTLATPAAPTWPKTVGWYGRYTVVRLLTTPALQVVDVRTGKVVRTVPLRDVPALSGVQLGPRTGKAPGF